MRTCFAKTGASPPRGRRPKRRRILPRIGSRGGDAGTTIMEVLISVIILGIVIVPIFDALVFGRVLAARRGESRMALRLVERKVEQLMAAGYGSAGSDADITSVNLSSGTHPIDSSIVVNTRGDTDGGNDVIGNLTWGVTDVSWTSPGDDVNAKRVEVRIAWPASAPRDSVTVTTLIGA